MKKYSYIAFLLFLTVNLSSNELGWVNKQIEAIKPAREGVSNSVISDLRDPFVFYKSKKYKKTYKQKEKFSSSNMAEISGDRSSDQVNGFKLNAIMNKSALISGKWYKLDDTIGSYKLTAVNNTSVVLQRNGKERVLSMYSKNKTLKFKK